MLILKSSIIRVALRVIGLLVNALLFGFMSRNLSSNDMGNWVLASSMTSVVMSFDFGISNYVRNKVVVDNPDRELIFRCGFTAALIIGIIYFLFSILAFCNVVLDQKLSSAESFSKGNLFLALMFVSLRIPLFVAINSFFSFREENLYGVFDFFVTVLSAVFSCVVIAFTKNVRASIIVFYTSGLVVYMIAFVWFMKLRTWRIALDKHAIPQILRGAWPYGVLQLVSGIQNSMPALIVGLYISIESVPPIRAAMMIGQTILSLHLTHAMPIWTEASRLVNQESLDGFAKIKKQLIREVVLLSMVLCIIAPFGNIVIETWTGRRNGDHQMFSMMMLWTFGCGLSNLYSLITNGFSRPLVTAVAVLPGGIISLLLSFGLSGKYKTAGVAVAFALGSGISSIFMCWLAYRTLNQNSCVKVISSCDNGLC